MEKKWRTAITQHVGHETYIRGYRLLDLVGNLSFAQAIYLILKGELPTDKICVSFFRHFGFTHTATLVREISNKRMPSGPMKYEYVVILRKSGYNN